MKACARVLDMRNTKSGAKSDWWIEKIHHEDRQRISDHIHAAIDGGAEVWQNAYRYLRRDGSYASVFDRGRIVYQEVSRSAWLAPCST